MSITFRCECGAVHSVDESEVGVVFHCEACGLDLPVPAESSVPEGAPAGEAPPPAPGDVPSPEADDAEASFARLVEDERPHADAGELAEIVDPGHAHAHAKEELATMAQEVDPAHQGSAADLVAQIRAARAGVPASALGDLAAAGPRPAVRPARPRAMTAHQRASHHLGFKKFMWKPVFVMGVVCAVFGLFCLVRLVWTRTEGPPPRPAGLPAGFSGQALIDARGRPIKDAQGHALFVGGKIVKDEKGQETFVKLSVAEKKRIVRDPQGDPWLVDVDADEVKWQGGVPTATAGGFDIAVTRAEEDEDFAAFEDAEHPARHEPNLSLGYLGFAIAFLVVSPTLLILAVWMRRHVALVAGSAPAPDATGGPVPAKPSEAGVPAGAAPGPDSAAEAEVIIDAELADAPDAPGATGGPGRRSLGEAGLPASAPVEPDSEPTPKDPAPAD